MYTVLIAEDELLVRMGIASSVPWMQMGMHVVAETADGASAWEAFQKFQPDIVIADIRMPKMNGLELLRKIREVDSDCEVIIVTNVEHGPTLEEARRLGITDVLIKAAMKRDDITAAVLKARASLPAERGSRVLPEDNAELWWEYISHPKMDSQSFRAKYERENAAFFQPKGFAVMHICPSERISHRLKASLCSLFVHRLGNASDYCMIERSSGCIVLAKNDCDTERIESMLTDLSNYVHDNFGERIRFAICSETMDLEELRSAINSALRLIRMDEFFDRSVLRLCRKGFPVFAELTEEANELRRYVLLSRQGKLLSQCADEIEMLPEMLAADCAGAMENGRWILAQLSVKMDFTGVYGMVQALVNAVKEAIDTAQAEMRPEILVAMQYIEDHIAEALSIRHVSEVVGYHPAYFSNLFKHELGISYSDFLTLLRIQRAKKLLICNEYTLQEIAKQCGFSDLSYFSLKFKRVVGMTPSQWRAKTCERASEDS